MEFKEYQKIAGETDFEELQPLSSIKFISILLGVVGEAGEIAEKFKKIYRDRDAIITEEDKTAIKRELGDILWYVNSLGRHLGFTLEEIAKTNLEKLADRRKRNVIRGNGDNR